MKISTLGTALVLTCSALAHPAVAAVDAKVTSSPQLEKRRKEVVINKDYKKLQDLKNGEAETSEAPKPWVRTIYKDKVEIVTPTIIAGVTISAKPPTTTDGLEPWISLNADGSPKTINPKMKNGVIKNKSPDYSTWFQDVKTVTYNKEELRAHNMEEDEVFVEEKLIPEDLTYRLLNPIVRCTPDLYKMKGVGKDQTPEPFCFPRDNSRLYMDKSYFITWYYPFFGKNVEKVRVHLSYVKESWKQKGMRKRDLDASENIVEKRSEVMQKGGQLSKNSFYMSEWLPKEEGMLPITIDPEWFNDGEYYHKILISLQPDNMTDDEFDHLENFVVVEIAQKARVAKGTYLDLKEQEELNELKALHGEDYDIEEGLDLELYMTIVTLPTCVLVAAVLMYLFVSYNKRQYDLGFLKKVKLNRMKTKTKKGLYMELPQWLGEKKD